MHTSSTTNIRGIALLEVIVSLALSGTILIGLVLSYQSITSLTTSAYRMYADARGEAFIESFLNEVSADLDLHRMKVFPRILSDDLRYMNGELFTRNVIPSPESMALFYLSAERGSPYTLKGREPFGDGIRAEICIPSSSIENRDDPIGFIGISEKGPLEIVGRLQDGASLTPCPVYTLKPSKGVIVRGPTGSEIYSILKVLLITKSYGIIKDSDHQLRRFTFRGDTLVENQPITRDVPSFTFQQVLSPQSIWSLQVDILKKGMPHHRLLFSSHLSRIEHFSILFNDLYG